MSASVSRLVPRSGSFFEALAAYRAGAIGTCLSALHSLDSVEADLLRSRAYLRLGDARAARESLLCTEPVRNRDRGEMALLSAVASFRLGHDDTASDLFRDAFVFGISSLDIALETEIEFYKGLALFARGDLHEARASCERGLEMASGSASRHNVGATIPLEHIESRLEELLGLIAAAQGRFGTWLIHARSALHLLDTCGVRDVWQEAFALKNLTILARDFDVAGDAEIVAERAPSFAWTKDLCRVEFATLEALGWSAALRGQCVDALGHFRQADVSASTSAEHIIVGMNRAVFAREAGHRAQLIEEVRYATKLARDFDWESAPGDTRYGLLTLAQVAAPLETSTAREMLDRHTAIRNAIDPTFVARIEPGTQAEEAYTNGIVLRAEGRVAASAERLRTAFETWGAIGFEWRAARAALELIELDAGDVFRIAVRREINRRPNSVFSTRARLVA